MGGGGVVDILRSDGHWGDGTLVCRECGQRQATEPPGGAPLFCEPCHRLRKRGVCRRMFDAVLRLTPWGDGEAR